jgi:hypothetical protein
MFCVGFGSEQTFTHQPGQEAAHNREPLSPRRCRSRLPVPIEEGAHHSPTLRWFELVEGQVGVLPRPVLPIHIVHGSPPGGE